MGPQGSRAPFFTCRSLIITVSLISLILIATVAIFRSYLLDPLLTCAISSCSNYNRQCPPQPDPPGVTSSVFFEDPILISLDPKDDDAWATKTSTPGGGYLWAAHNSSLDLTYGINMFHSLHCLQILRAMLQQLDQPQGHEARSSEHHHHTVMGGVHTGHCVGYGRIHSPKKILVLIG